MMTLSRAATSPRSLILTLIAGMMFLSLLSSTSIQYGHADTPIAASAEQIKPLTAGRIAPHFYVETVDGESFEFDPRSLERPAVLITFRGGWCPYCNMHLSELRHIIPEIKASGIDVLFLSGDRPAALYDSLKANTREQIDGLDYKILSDANAHAAVALGVAFKVEQSYIDRLHDGGRDIQDSSIERRGVLPVPAVFAVGTDGVIAFAHTNPDYKVRLPEDELFAAAMGLITN